MKFIVLIWRGLRVQVVYGPFDSSVKALDFAKRFTAKTNDTYQVMVMQEDER